MDINNILYIITFLAIFFYLLKINRLLYYYIFTCLILVGFIVSKDFPISITIAGILTALIYVFLDKQIPLRFKKSVIRNLEHYENASNKKNKKKEKFVNKHAIRKNEKSKPDSDTESEQEDFEPSNSVLNKKESFKSILGSLNSSEISSLNTDTKALIDTQKQLMETLQSMGPALKEGKTILDTFKNYFNDSNLDKLKL